MLHDQKGVDVCHSVHVNVEEHQGEKFEANCTNDKSREVVQVRSLKSFPSCIWSTVPLIKSWMN
jgi:hypothetical protein